MSVALFANIFSCTVGCLFVLFMVSFAAAWLILKGMFWREALVMGIHMVLLDQE